MIKKYFFATIIFTLSLLADAETQNCKLSDTPYAQLLRQIESGNDYGNFNFSSSCVYNGGKCGEKYKKEIGSLTNYTIREVIDMQKQKIVLAAGAYQMAVYKGKSNVEFCVEQLGNIDTNSKFDKSFQDRCFNEVLTTSKKWNGAIHNYFYGNGSIEAAAAKTANEWASVPKADGTGVYNDGRNKVLTTYDTLISAMEKSKEQIKLNQCNPEEQPDNNATGPDNNTTTSTTQPTIKKYDIKNNTYFGECIDIDFNPEINSCGFSPASPKVVMGGNGNAFSYTHENDSSTFCYCATDMNAEAGQYGVVNSIVIPSEVKINEETTQMLIDSINTLVYLKEYWTRGLGAEAFGLGPQATLQLSNNMEQRQLSHALEEKNKDKCLILDLKINEISSRINKLEQELIKMTQRD